MPFDLARAATRLRDRHAQPVEFRHALLDLLFATGAAVSEQVVALEYGDALCIRAAGPAAPGTGRARLLIAVDLNPPQAGSADVREKTPPSWPAELASLGGPSVALGWLATLHALVRSAGQQPWQALYVRGPALGTAPFVRSLLDEMQEGAEIIQIAPSVVGAAAWSGAFDVVALAMTRARNVWRFPSCDQTWAVSAHVDWQDALPALRGLLGGLGDDVAWTLHELVLYPSGTSRLSAILRTSTANRPQWPGVEISALDDSPRLLFPVNDALAATTELAGRLDAHWRDALAQPLAIQVLPDGMQMTVCLDAAAAHDVLPDRAGALSLEYRREALAVAPPASLRGFALTHHDEPGPVPAGVLGGEATLWRLPSLATDAELDGVARALQQAV